MAEGPLGVPRPLGIGPLTDSQRSRHANAQYRGEALYIMEHDGSPTEYSAVPFDTGEPVAREPHFEIQGDGDIGIQNPEGTKLNRRRMEQAVVVVDAISGMLRVIEETNRFRVIHVE